VWDARHSSSCPTSHPLYAQHTSLFALTKCHNTDRSYPIKYASIAESCFNRKSSSEPDIMEVISAGGSILSFIQITASTGFAIAQIVRRFHDAPEEFQQIARQLSLLHSELHFINELQGAAGEEDLALLPDEANDLRKALEQAQTLISSVEKACKKYKPQGQLGVPIRLRWVLQDQAKMKNTVSQLQQIQSSLHTILLLINM